MKNCLNILTPKCKIKKILKIQIWCIEIPTLIIKKKQ